MSLIHILATQKGKENIGFAAKNARLNLEVTRTLSKIGRAVRLQNQQATSIYELTERIEAISVSVSSVEKLKTITEEACATLVIMGC